MKECPDLTTMSSQEKRDFWLATDPRELKSLGDRLLAESLPHARYSRTREEVSQDIHDARRRLGWSLRQVGLTLGVTEELFAAWEEDRVRAPECLPYVLERLRELAVQPTSSQD